MVEEKPWFRHWPEGVPRTLEYPEGALQDLLGRTARAFPDRPALIFYGRRMTYGQLDEASGRFAAGLRALGIAEGDRVALHLPNVPHYPVAFFGILKAGAVVVQTNPIYTPRELAHLLRDSGASAIVTLDIFWPTVEKVHGEGAVERAIVGDAADYLPGLLRLLYPLKKRRDGQAHRIPTLPWVSRFTDLLTRSEPPGEVAKVNPRDDVAVLQYTGGTTGTPKGAMLTHYNLSANALQTASWLAGGHRGGEVFLSVLPFFHVYGLTVDLLSPISLGATMVLHPNPREVDHILRLIQRWRPSVFPGVPTLYVALNHHPKLKRYDLSSVKACISGAAPLPLEVRRQFEANTGGRLVEGYGLSEASPVTHANPLFGLVKDGSVGLPFPDTDARIVDLETGNKFLGPGEEGELVVRGPQVMKGYWNLPEETARVLREGWLYTGDIGRMDDEGYFYIVDRKKDLIICSGYNVYPREVEEVLFEHPAVQEAAAIGIPDEYRGETVKAIVVLKAGQRATAEEIQAFCRERLAPYKVPKVVEFAQELPKTLVGKVLRRALRGTNA